MMFIFEGLYCFTKLFAKTIEPMQSNAIGVMATSIIGFLLLPIVIVLYIIGAACWIIEFALSKDKANKRDELGEWISRMEQL